MRSDRGLDIQVRVAKPTAREVNLNLPAKLQSDGEHVAERSTSGSSTPGRWRDGRSASSEARAPRGPRASLKRRQPPLRRDGTPGTAAFGPGCATHHHPLPSRNALGKRNHARHRPSTYFCIAVCQERKFCVGLSAAGSTSTVIDVESDHGVPRVNKPRCHRQAHKPQSDHGDATAAVDGGR